ncbi:MAG TPA: EAL domain-containing response regulator [Polyangiaceae bacterium]|jgi:EAL domain-containing protein (putative c-di-GMP-specific phosphodiesterase class I)
MKGAVMAHHLTSAETETVLLVDDEPLVLRSFARSLAPSPHAVETFVSAREAVERVRRGGVAAVVSDVSMPEMTGLELLRMIREYEPDLPIVLVTALPMLESALDAIQYGAFRYIPKPVNPELLRLTVDQAVNLHRLARVKREALTLMGLSVGASDRAGLEAGFERALDDMWMAFHPVVRATDGSVFGYEALLRTREPLLPGPGEVLDAADRLGESRRLGRLARERAAMPMSQAAHGTQLFVNLHPRDLDDPELGSPDSLLGSIADRVVLEVTEREPLTNVERIRDKVAALRMLGFRIAIDDLGAGYAGLTSFATLEPDIVKLDMSLVRNIDHEPVKQKVVASMVGLCKDMGLLIVAEGIETAPERDTLVSLGCDLLQGYLFARPGPPFPRVAGW